MKPARSNNTDQSKQGISKKPRPEIRDDLDSRQRNPNAKKPSARKKKIRMIVNTYADLAHLEMQFGAQKKIPSEFRSPVLQALSHFPELEKTPIKFRSAKGLYPLRLHPVFFSARQNYKVDIVMEADPPLRDALLLNLPEEAQRAAVAQQLALILCLEQKGAFQRLGRSFFSFAPDRELTRKADLLVISHGLGFELYVHAVYIRKIAGYCHLHEELDKFHLHPQEIMDALQERA